MSPNMTSYKSSNIFTSYFWPALMALIMAVFLSQWAVADPPSQTETNEIANTESTLPVDTEEPADIPKSLAEDGATKSDSPLDTIQAQKSRVLSVTSVPAEKLPKKCYEQTDGSFECVCEGEEECKLLATAKYCEPGTHWGKDGYGGCTRTSDK
ncbi:MAG: hypothetical protein EX271_02085 [Acidimicrobiales bacterium]|nr:hypothetical protein [Hyphomonadaceae bacterium]RZV44289.1 MAG: hypothetical protein EX271_02085 [Acidimicrobiales bacterium]